MTPYRFLNPAKASCQKQSTSSPAHLETPSRPSKIHRRQSSTQFAPTPRFAVASTPRAASSGADAIEDLDDENSNDDLASIDTEQNEEVGGSAVMDSFDDLLAMHERRKSKFEAVLDDQSVVSEADDLITTTYASKRRKVQQDQEAIYVSSSPSPGSPVLSASSDPEDDFPMLSRKVYRLETGSGPTLEENPVASKTATDSDHRLPRTERQPKRSRFQSTAAPPTPLSPSAPSARPSFIRPLISSRSAAATVTADALLPDAFSPSKRRGRMKDCLLNGMADTMVNWILAMGQEEESRAREFRQTHGQISLPATSKHEYERVIHVVRMRTDGNERGIIVTGHDGETYLLSGSPANVSTGRGTHSIDIGSTIGLRKGNLSWGVQLSNLHDGNEVIDNRLSSNLMVSALWDIDPT